MSQWDDPYFHASVRFGIGPMERAEMKYARSIEAASYPRMPTDWEVD